MDKINFDELIVAKKELAFQNEEKKNRAAELVIAKKELAFQNKEKKNRAAELIIAKKELAFQNKDRLKRAAELVIAKKELAFQKKEKGNRATELILANKELAFQKHEKVSRAAELIIANKEHNQLDELFQSNLKEISDYKYALDEATIIAITDKKGNIKKVNSNFCKISKYSEEELIGKDHRIVNSGYHSKDFFNDLWVTIANGKIWKGEVKDKAKDGTFYWVDTTIVPFLDEQNKPYQYLAIRVDITDRKEAEEYLIQRTAQLGIANKELAFQNDEKENRAAELIIANKELAFQNDEKENRAAELIIANKELAFQNDEKENRAAELIIANKELAFQNDEKENRAAELIIANKELAFQNDEKENRAAELIIANKELAFQNNEKENRAAELVIANKELAFQNDEKENRASELVIANKELAFQNDEKENRASELVIANKELAFQNDEKENRASELVIANKELAFQNDEKENRAAELVIANKELAFQNDEKENRAAELVIANKELAFQNDEKENRAAELVIANKELAFQNDEKENRAAELVVANIELAFQNDEKGNREAELIIANIELAYQNEEKEKREADLIVLAKDLKSQQEELKRANDLLMKQEERVRIINQELLLLNQELEGRVANRTKALAESENRFRNMMETIPQIAWTNTIDGEVTFYNQRWFDYTGLDSKQTKTWGLDTVIHPDDLKNAVSEYKSIRETSDGGEFQIRGKRADGLYRWHLIRLMPIRNEDGQMQLWVGTATDIQELRLLQQQKDDFISIASHELKTPLTTLKASLQLLNKMKDNPSSIMLPNLIGQANKSLDKVSVLIQDLLNASKVNEGQLHLSKKPFIIASLINDCCPHVRTEGIYTIKAQGDLKLEVFADEGRIDQIVINFVNNAIKYAPQSKEIEIKIERENDMAKVSVTDKGPGISPEKLPHLFERYFRVDSSGSQYSGLGLGLYICAEIIKKHNGQIGVDSEMGKGSTFWFTLPLVQNEIT
jgi:two-component system CheB/CheR fusion protein